MCLWRLAGDLKVYWIPVPYAQVFEGHICLPAGLYGQYYSSLFNYIVMSSIKEHLFFPSKLQMMLSAGWVGNSALSFTRTLLPSIHHHFPCLALLSLLSPHNRILWICQSNIDRIEILSCKHIAFAIRCKALSKHKDHGDGLRKQLGLCRAFGSCEH